MESRIAIDKFLKKHSEEFLIELLTELLMEPQKENMVESQEDFKMKP